MAPNFSLRALKKNHAERLVKDQAFLFRVLDAIRKTSDSEVIRGGVIRSTLVDKLGISEGTSKGIFNVMTKKGDKELNDLIVVLRSSDGTRTDSVCRLTPKALALLGASKK